MTFHEKLQATLNFLRIRKKDYQLTFQLHQPANQAVLVDLANFCGAGSTSFRDDPLEMAKMAGRREVFLRINYHLHLTEDQLFSLYSGNPATPTERAT